MWVTKVTIVQRTVGAGRTDMMKNTLEYQGYIGSIEFSEEDKVFFGKVQGIRSLISYEGKTPNVLIDDFHNAVDDYLALCEANNEEPE